MEAFGSFDVFKIDGAKGWLQQLADLNDIVRIVRVDFNVEDVHVGEALEQNGLALHHRLGRERADVAETEHGSSIAHYRNQIAPARVLERIVRGPKYSGCPETPTRRPIRPCSKKGLWDR